MTDFLFSKRQTCKLSFSVISLYDLCILTIYFVDCGFSLEFKSFSPVVSKLEVSDLISTTIEKGSSGVQQCLPKCHSQG